MKRLPEPDKTIQADVLVIGAGLGGICAAIQAARLGCSVVLAEKQMTLGGNSSPEIGVHPSDAHRFHPYMAATGIVNEIIEEAAWRQAKTVTAWRHYSVSPLWDTILAEKLKQAGVTLLRRHDAFAPEMSDNQIQAVYLANLANWKTVKVAVRHAVIDASGDGHIAAQAGASWTMGRESRSEYQERSAPETADRVTMGSSLVALVRRTSEKVLFVPPEGTPDFYPGYGGDLDFQPGPDDDLVFFFPTETGGDLDTIEDEAAIYDRLISHLYSAWHYVKNIKNPKETENWELVWISNRVAKRESRRFRGDTVLTQQDVESGRIFDDAVAYGGFAVDVHHPKPENPHYVRINYISIPPVYTIPYRSLYSREISNLLFASRLLSATHLAHGTIRLQRTLGVVGQAAGAAAALMVRHACTARAVGQQHLRSLQQTLLRQGASIPGVAAADPEDLARLSHVAASSHIAYRDLFIHAEFAPIALKTRLGFASWAYTERIDHVGLNLRSRATVPVPLRLSVYRYQPERPYQLNNERSKEIGYASTNEAEWGNDWHKASFTLLLSRRYTIEPGAAGWQTLPVQLDVGRKDALNDDDRLLFVFDRQMDLDVWVSRQHHPLVRLLRGETETDWLVEQGMLQAYLDPAPPWGEAAQVIAGTDRRWSTYPFPAWQPDLSRDPEPTLDLTWDVPVTIRRIQLVFDGLTRAAHDMPFECGKRVSPQLVRDYTLELYDQAHCVGQITATDQFRRLACHRFDPVTITRLRLRFVRAWDSQAQPAVYAIRVYADE